MKNINLFFKRIPLWLLSFLIVNIAYLIFKDIIFYLVFIISFLSVIVIKLKRNKGFLVIEIIILALYILMFIIAICNKEQNALKMILLNLGTWFFVYLFL